MTVAIVCLAFAAFGCGRDVRTPEQGGSGTSGPLGSQDSGADSTGGGSSPSTGVEACSVVMTDFVEVSDPASAAAYVNVRRFEGGLAIRDWPDETLGDSFPCLEEIGYLGLGIYDSDSLRSLEGLETLRSIDGAGIHIGGNSRLRTLRGLDGLEETRFLDVFRNGELLEVGLPAIQDLPRMTLGACLVEGQDALEFSNGLEDIGGFESLQTLGELVVSGQANLRSISSIQRITDNGKGRVVGPVTFQHNPMLPMEELAGVQAGLSEGSSFFSCGNLNEDATNACFCAVE